MLVGAGSYTLEAGGDVSSGNGANVSYSVDVTILTNVCTSCSLSPTSASYGVDAGAGNISVSTSTTDCVWAAQSSADWVTITSPATGAGTGAGTVSYLVAANCDGNSRSATLTVNDQTFTITQAGNTIWPT